MQAFCNKSWYLLLSNCPSKKKSDHLSLSLKHKQKEQIIKKCIQTEFDDLTEPL